MRAPATPKRVGVLAVALVLLLAAGCGDDEKATSTSKSKSKSSSTTTTSTSLPPTSEPPTDGATTVVYLVVDERIEGENPPETARSRPVVSPALLSATGTDARAAVSALGALPADEIPSGYANAVPPGTEVLGFDLVRGSATVDLSDELAGASQPDLAVAEVVFTATRDPAIQAVRVRVGGGAVDGLPGGTLDLGEPLTRADLEVFTPTVAVEEPPAGASVASPLTVRGTANTFEATLRLEVVDERGTVLVDETVTASSGSGTRGTYKTALLFDAAAGPITLRAFYDSPATGSREAVLEVPLTSG